MAKLVEICKVDWGDTRLTKAAYKENGKYLGVSAAGCDGRMDYYDYDAFTPVISAIGANCGKMFLPEEPFVAIKNTITLKPNDSTSGKYLYYALINNKIPKRGGGQPFISKGDTEQYDIPCPSKKEQAHIVEVLDSLCRVIDERKAQLTALDELTKARFVEMFGGSKTYPIRPLSDIAEYWNGLTYKPTDVSNDGTIVLRSSNIQNMQLDLNDIVRVKCDIGNKKIVEKNDILMCSRNGSAKLVGKVALIPNLQEQMSFGAFMMIIRSEYYSYLMTYFQLPEFRSQISTGTTTINQITRYMLDKVKLPVPDKASIDEFSTFVAQIDKSKFAVQKSLEETQLLFDCLMQEYFG